MPSDSLLPPGAADAASAPSASGSSSPTDLCRRASDDLERPQPSESVGEPFASSPTHPEPPHPEPPHPEPPGGDHGLIDEQPSPSCKTSTPSSPPLASGSSKSTVSPGTSVVATPQPPHGDHDLPGSAPPADADPGGLSSAFGSNPPPNYLSCGPAAQDSLHTLTALGLSLNPMVPNNPPSAAPPGYPGATLPWNRLAQPALAAAAASPDRQPHSMSTAAENGTCRLVPFPSAVHHASCKPPPYPTGPVPPAAGLGGESSGSSSFGLPTSHPASSTSPPHLQRSVSVDATAPQHELLGAIQLLYQQLSFLVQAWMTDRERLEPKQQRAEENFLRLQAVMDSSREHWAFERAALERQLDALRVQVQRLNEENAALRTSSLAGIPAESAISPLLDQRNGSGHGAAEGSSASSGAAAAPSPGSSLMPNVLSLPPGLDGASRRPHFVNGSPRTSPTRPPAPSAQATLDPRTLPRKSAAKDFLAPQTGGRKLPTPVIDVHEIDPKLEGIPIKTNALRRATFSPPRVHQQPNITTRRSGQGREMASRRELRGRHWSPRNLSVDRGRASGAKRVSRDQTMQVLAAEESRRLTMHAGHTPNHSLSLLSTMTATGGDSTANGSRGATPSADTEWAIADTDPETEAKQQSPDSDADFSDDSADGLPESGDDVPLKGPLMIRNIPAQDDRFLAQLNRKLESVSRGECALPSVLLAISEEPEPAPEKSGREKKGPAAAAATGGDASRDGRAAAAAADEAEDSSDGDDVGLELPLRLKNTSNFGKPFGLL